MLFPFPKACQVGGDFKRRKLCRFLSRCGLRKQSLDQIRSPRSSSIVIETPCISNEQTLYLETTMSVKPRSETLKSKKSTLKQKAIVSLKQDSSDFYRVVMSLVMEKRPYDFSSPEETASLIVAKHYMRKGQVEKAECIIERRFERPIANTAN